MDDIVNKVAIVTGAASGIGRGCALALANAGARVALCDIDMAGAEDAADEIIRSGGEAVPVFCDVGCDGSFEAVRDSVLDRWGQIDIIMNNAGVILSGHPEDIPVSEWQRVLNINLMSVVRSNSVFLPILIAQRSGHIVNTASFAGIMTYSYDRLPYAASKAAIFQISEGLALYLRPKGIGVTVLCPGPVATNIMSSTKLWTDGVEIRGPGKEFELLSPAQVGEQVIDAIRLNQFFLPTHSAVTARLVKRARDFDANLQNEIECPSIISMANRPKIA